MTNPLFHHIHFSAFHDPHVFAREMALFVNAAESLGHTTSVEHGVIRPDALNILFATHSEPLASLKNKAEHIIIYNLEQIGPDVPWLSPNFLHILNHFYAWDYNEQNREILLANNAKHIDFVPMGYMPAMSCIPTNVPQDIDVLFYGTINPRRKQLLQKISELGVHLVSNDSLGRPILGEELDSLIARSKLVLNAHYYEDTHVFEIARVSHLLANGKAVVSEISPHTAIEPSLREAICGGLIDELPKLVQHLLTHDDERLALAKRGQAIYQARDQKQIFSRALANYQTWYEQQPHKTSFEHQETAPTRPQPLPKRINYCRQASHWQMFALNIGSRPAHEPDIVLLPESFWPLNQPLHCPRFGSFTIESGSISRIDAPHIAQCVPNLRAWLLHMLDTLCEGGTLHLQVPYDLSQYAWADLDTRRTFNEVAWNKVLEKLKDEQHPQGYFTKTRCEHFILTENHYGKHEAKMRNNDLSQLLHLPHVVDGLSLILSKNLRP